jgi:DNA-binding response OmpR family regulator
MPAPRRPLRPRSRAPNFEQCNCPVCGEIMPRRKIVVDLEWNRVAFDGRLLELTETEAEIVALLETERPKLVSMDLLRRRVFVHDVTDSRVYTHMGRIKNKLGNIGLGIRLHAGYGWRLEILPIVSLS